jgi:acyl-[acyl-carrier-protein]-phospholipid O-acyltransferase/long-chain-fatty-acid--[acyl-carrier-protein] ligase
VKIVHAPLVLALLDQWASLVDCWLVLWIALGAIALLAVIAVWRRPHRLIRLPILLLSRTFYRLRVYGRQHIPKTGPALLVCNHVSHIDALLLLAAQKRPIRFLIWAPFVHVRFLRLFLWLARVIPVDSRSGPRAIIHSLRAASEALAQGELVCIFAEGAITRTGFLLPFHRGFEQIVKRTPAPIIPVCLDHVWGSIFSYRGGRFFWKWPQKIPYPVSVAFGTALPATATPMDVRLAIQKLSADCSIQRNAERLPVHRHFVRLAIRHPFRTCMNDPNNPKKPFYSYGTILIGAKIAARMLRPILGDAAMVGLWLPPSAGGAVANIALAFLRKTSVNLNYTSSSDLVRSALQQCAIRHVLTSRQFTAKLPLEAAALGDGVELIYLEDLRKEVTPWRRLRAFLGMLLCWPLPGFLRERFVPGLRRHRIDDLATVIFSSGSTGDPKGIMLTHANIAANVESMVQAIDPGPRDRLLGTLPFFHSFGYTVTVWVPLQVGTSLVYHADPRQAKEIGELCQKLRCTIFLATPTFLRFCLRRCQPGDFASLRLIVVGAEKLPPSLALEFQEKFGVLPLEGYGCTELAPAAIINVPDWERGDLRQVGNKPGTIGQPLPGVAARIVHPETFEPLVPGQDGLLLVYGANVMKGYLGRPEQTRDVIRDGWYVTGDIARYDEDGFVTITDRLTRFSKVGGEMVPHQKVEDELQAIVGSTERTFVVTAVPDESKGERLIVFHLPLNGKDIHQVWQQLNDRGLPNLYVPKERDFFQIPELPILGTGKLDLKRVKEMALERTRA